MTLLHSSLVFLVALALTACDSGAMAPGGGSDGAIGGAHDAATRGVPAWMLEDVQPQSPRTGQTYGLDAFANRIVVAVLLEGF